MEFWFWFIIFVLFIMLMNAKSDINRLERQLNELAKRLKTIMPPAETEAEKRPEEKDDAEKQTAIQLPPLPQPAAGTSAPLPQKQPRRPQTPDNGDGVNITFLGQKLITWIAGFAAVLGFFYFIRYSIENGLLGPVARLTAATLGGLLLTGAGCLLHYKQNVANHQRIGEALLGAGIAALYFAAYALAKIYQLAPEQAERGQAAQHEGKHAPFGKAEIGFEQVKKTEDNAKGKRKRCQHIAVFGFIAAAENSGRRRGGKHGQGKQPERVVQGKIEEQINADPRIESDKRKQSR